jgi:hypothetical protein
MKSFCTLAVLASLLVCGCNLSESERMDLSRKGVATIACVNPTFRFDGTDSVPLSALMNASNDPSLGERFELVWKDQGTNTSWNGNLQIRSGAQIVFVVWFDALRSTGMNAQGTGNMDWTEEIDSMRFVLSENPCSETESSVNLHVYDDRPQLSISIRNDTASIRSGDTLKIDLKNESTAQSIQAASDYFGLRNLGEYLITLKPGDHQTMKWLVVASPGGFGWVDLSWGTFGQSRRIQFLTR